MGLFDTIAGAFRGEAKQASDARPGRNEPCWCGSGNKYKRCHMQSDQHRQQAQRKTCCTTT